MVKERFRRVRCNKGQAILEYFLLFAMIALVTLLSFSTLLTRTRTAVQGGSFESGSSYFEKALNEIAPEIPRR